MTKHIKPLVPVRQTGNFKLLVFVGVMFLMGILVFGSYQVFKYAQHSLANEFPLPFSETGNADWCSSSLQQMLNSPIFTNTIGGDGLGIISTQDCGSKISLISESDWQAYKNIYQSVAGSFLPPGVTSAWTKTGAGDSEGVQAYVIEPTGTTSAILATDLADILPTVMIVTSTACIAGGTGTTADPYVMLPDAMCDPVPCTSIPHCLMCPLSYCEHGECDVGYYNQGDGCSACADVLPGCGMCPDANTCTACLTGHYLVGANCHVCADVLPGCGACANASTCTDCTSGYYLNETNTCSSCQQVTANCATCDDASTCTTCTPGYILEDGVCVPTGNDSNCTRYTAPNTCAPDGCISGYYSNEGACVACSSSIPGCGACTDASTCTSCSAGYYLAADRCRACSAVLSHCTACSDGYTCMSCESGYEVTGGKCTPKPTPTPSSACPAGQYRRDGQCLPICNLTACLTCSSANYCQECNTGYQLVAGSCRPACNTPHCHTCATPNTCSPFGCEEGYYLRGGVCVPTAAPTPTPTPTPLPSPTPSASPAAVVATTYSPACEISTWDLWRWHLGFGGGDPCAADRLSLAPDLYTLLASIGVATPLASSLQWLVSYLLLPVLLLFAFPLAIYSIFFPLPRGKITTTIGAPIAGVLIVVTKEGKFITSRLSSATGHYLGFRLAHGEYLIYLSKPGVTFPPPQIIKATSDKVVLAPNYGTQVDRHVTAVSPKQVLLTTLSRLTPWTFIFTLVTCLLYLNPVNLAVALVYIPSLIKKRQLLTPQFNVVGKVSLAGQPVTDGLLEFKLPEGQVVGTTTSDGSGNMRLSLVTGQNYVVTLVGANYPPTVFKVTPNQELDLKF